MICVETMYIPSGEGPGRVRPTFFHGHFSWGLHFVGSDAIPRSGATGIPVCQTTPALVVTPSYGSKGATMFVKGSGIIVSVLSATARVPKECQGIPGGRNLVAHQKAETARRLCRRRGL